MKYLDKSLPVFTNFTILMFYWHACELSYNAEMVGAVHICLYSKCAKFIRTVPDDKDPPAEGRIILKWVSEKCDGGMDWIHLAEDRDRWSALVNAVMNFRVPKMRGVA